jgi:hypothetical protein
MYKLNSLILTTTITIDTQDTRAFQVINF